MKENTACLCGINFFIEYNEEIDLDQNIDTIEEICSGMFMRYACPGCGKIHKPEKTITLIWNSKNIKYEVLPELERMAFYRSKKNKTYKDITLQTIIGYPEMADRITVLKDGLEPVVIEALKYYLLLKAGENYPDNEINAWYFEKSGSSIEFHLDGIKPGEVAVMKVPEEIYNKTLEDWKKRPKTELYSQLYYYSYLSVQNVFKPEFIK